MILELLFIALVALGAFSIAVMLAVGLMNATAAALVLSRSPRLDHDKHHQRMDSLFDVNLPAVMPAVVGSYLSHFLLNLFFPERVEALFGGTHWSGVALIAVTAGFSFSLSLFFTARNALCRRREHEA